MSNKDSSQSINISDGLLSSVQIGGIAGRDQTVSKTLKLDVKEMLMQTDVVNLITQLEAILKGSELPKEQTIKALLHLQSVKEEVQAEEPDKDYAAISLKKATIVLKEAGETLEKGSNLWNKMKQIVEEITPWLGVATGFFL